MTDLMVDNDVKMNADQYHLCKIAADNMWASKKKGVWGKGGKNTHSDPKRVEREGCLCEMLFSIWSGLPTNFGYIEGGDKHDFIVHNTTINVKMAWKDHILVRAKTHQDGEDIFSNHDIYVGVRLNHDNKVDSAAGTVLGYYLGSVLKLHEEEPAVSKKFNHMNFVVRPHQLRSINTLQKFLEDPVTTL